MYIMDVKSIVDKLLNEGSSDKAKSTSYYKKLVRYIQDKFPDASMGDIELAHDMSWSSGSNTQLTSMQQKLMKVMYDMDDQELGASERELDAYLVATGQA